MAAVFTSIALGTLGALIFKENIEKASKVDVVSTVNNKTYAVIRTGTTSRRQICSPLWKTKQGLSSQQHLSSTLMTIP